MPYFRKRHYNPWPGQYKYLLVEELNAPWDNIGKSTIPGSPMKWRWENSGTVSPDARLDIPDWELLSITEGVPLYIDTAGLASSQQEGLAEQRSFFSQFVNNAWNNGDNGNGAPTLLWTTWTNIDDSDGPWRDLLDLYEEEWENMQDYANTNLPQGGTPVYLIPGHRMMARLYDDIQNDLVPGIDSLPQFFDDNIHVNSLGAYAVAMIHYACIFNASPVGLSNNLYYDQNNTNHPSEALASYLQTMIWEEVTSYSGRTGVVDPLLNTKNQSESELVLYPNPVESVLTLNGLKNGEEVVICDTYGRVVLESNNGRIDLSGLESGIYVVDVNGVVNRVVKR